MSASSQPYYAPIFFPLANIIEAYYRPWKDLVELPKKIIGNLNITGYLTLVASSVRAAIFAYMAMYLGSEYPGFGTAKTFEIGWMLTIVTRNLVFTWVVCGVWDWFLYFSPMKEKMHKYKITPKYPSKSQFWHDAKYTTLASLIAAGIEICLCNLWSRGLLSYQANWWISPYLNFAVIGTTSISRSPHFYTIHRLMHPWRSPYLPDFGKFLYKRVHSLHHKSHNPTSWSGTSMHPVESFLYYSACFMPALAGLHPLITITFIVDSGLSAWTSHDGFTWPGSGNPFHMLHHSAFDCNYGNEQIPLDKWFGTFAAKKEDIGGIWHKN